MRVRPQQYSIRRSLHRVRRGCDSVKVLQWIWRLRESTEQCGTSVLKMTKQKSDDFRVENSLNFFWEAHLVTSFLLCWAHVQHEKSANWKQRKLSHRSETKLQVAHGNAKTLCSWISQRFQFVGHAWNSISHQWSESVQHRWSNVSLEFENSRIERQNRVHEKANKMDHEFQRIWLKCFVEIVDGNLTRYLFTWQEDQRQCLRFLHHLW